jgi:IrrE N-terminal-like domain
VEVADVVALHGATLVSADDLVAIERLEELERIQWFAFSACTFHIDGRHIIVTNPLWQPGRRASDVAHEIAHLFLKHDLTEIRVVAGVPFRTCRPDQEEEATALGGTRCCPDPCYCAPPAPEWTLPASRGPTGSPKGMARYRFNSTGVGNQLRNVGSRRVP